ncbi:MAG: PKD domain-containing protein, partial [Saprospiraceae bacterium]
IVYQPATCASPCSTVFGAGNGTFTWSGPNGFTSTEQNPTVCAPGTYTLTVTGANGCTSTASTTVAEDTDPPGATAWGGTITCDEPCVMLQGTGNGTFAWSGPNGFTSTEQNPTVCAAGTYTLTVTGTNGCTSTATAEVELDNSLPGAQAAGGTLTCTNPCVTLLGVGNGSFAWSGPDGFSSTEQNPTVCAAGTYTLTVTGSNGCTSTANAEVELDDEVPGAQAAGGTITCSNQCVTLQGTGNGSFAWSGPNGFSSTQQNPTVCAAGTYTLTVTGSNGCTSTAT